MTRGLRNFAGAESGWRCSSRRYRGPWRQVFVAGVASRDACLWARSSTNWANKGILTLPERETGTRLNTALLAGSMVDRVHLFVSPQIMGSDAVPAFKGMANAISIAEVEVERYETDLGLCSLLQDPWEKTVPRGQ